MGWFERLIGEEPSLLEQFFHNNDTGSFGEYLINYAVNNIHGYSESLCNVYIPYRGGTSEIDVIFIHETGIYVIESKNYSGWIFGSEESKTWTQCLPNGQKNKFYNPIMQNATHIKALRAALSDNETPIFSFIVFSERCTLKKVPLISDTYRVLKRPDLVAKMKYRINFEGKPVLSKEDITRIANKFRAWTNVSQEQKEKHIQDIKERINEPKCPKCGTILVKRIAKKGPNEGKEFYGCPNFPTCRYTRPISKET